jgi:hypothetical protein
MKRLASLVAITVLAVSTTNFANAADNYYGNGHVGHSSPRFAPMAHGNTSYYGHRYSAPAPRYGGHGFSPHVNSHAAVPYRNSGRRYFSQSNSGHGFNSGRPSGHASPSHSYGHGVRISTPHFGLRFGH